MNKTILSALCLIACLPVVGCLNNRYIAPVTAFRDSTNQTVSVLGDFYSSRNSYEIELYLSNVASDSKAEVATRNADGTFTPLGRPMFSPQAIKARLDALSLVGT